MSAYLIHIDPASGYTDESATSEYATNAGPIVEAFGGTYLVRHGPFRALEGHFDANHLTLIEFPSIDRLEEFYSSAEYRPWLELRKRISPDNHLIVVDG